MFALFGTMGSIHRKSIREMDLKLLQGTALQFTSMQDSFISVAPSAPPYAFISVVRAIYSAYNFFVLNVFTYMHICVYVSCEWVPIKCKRAKLSLFQNIDSYTDLF